MIHSNQWSGGSKRGGGLSRKGVVLVIKILVFFTGATVISVPFLVFPSLYTTADHEISILEKNLVASKVSLSPFQSKRRQKATTLAERRNVWFNHSLEDPPKDSPYTILHTITTRFMVGQAPNATEGASKQFDIQKARYLLFKAFCWPTMKRQTSMNFYWIVLVDPGLDPGIIRDMKALLDDTKHFPAQNAFLVLTNNTNWSSDGVGVENSTSYGVGLQPVAEEFREKRLEVVTGNTEYLLRALDTMDGNDQSNYSFLRASEKPLMIIETLLDADDGLNNGAVEWIQTKAIQRTREHWDEKQKQQMHATTLQKSSPSLLVPSLNTTWWLLCGTDHIEWHNREIFQLTEEKYAEKGITSGIVGLRQSPLFCTSAGFTRIGITRPPNNASSRSYSHMVFPKDGYSNHALTFYFPECTPSNNSIIPNGNYSACWHREFADKVYVVKSRTITSDSMDHLNVGKMKDYRDVSWLNASDYPLLINDTERMWGILKSEFSIERTRAWKTSAFIFEHRQSIVQQNKDFRCSPGFPCKKAARKNLAKMERYWGKQRALAREAKKKEASSKGNPTANEAKKDEEEKKIHGFEKKYKIVHSIKKNPANRRKDDPGNPKNAGKNPKAEGKKKALMGDNQSKTTQVGAQKDRIKESPFLEAIHRHRDKPKIDKTATKTHEKNRA